jgi:hypothetical protein
MSSWRLEFTKWDGQPHWNYDLAPLGVDHHGRWFGAPQGTQLRRGLEPPISWECDFLVLVPKAGEYVVTFNATGKYPVYVDVTGPVVIDDTVIRSVDLDVDVVRTAAGATLTLDEDEFEEHQRRYGYPAEIVERVKQTARALVRQVSQHVEPFGSAPAEWFNTLARASNLT